MKASRVETLIGVLNKAVVVLFVCCVAKAQATDPANGNLQWLSTRIESYETVRRGEPAMTISPVAYWEPLPLPLPESTQETPGTTPPETSPETSSDTSPETSTDALGRFQSPGMDPAASTQLANNFTADPRFASGIVVVRGNVALKIGGYVKADLIKDFNAINSPDSFDPTAIPTSGPQYERVNFIARQSRLSFDTRWIVEDQIARAFIEADFFGDAANGSDSLRMRHAYGHIGHLTTGQTWTTFTDPSAVPQTLDVDGSVSNVNRRQGLVRWTQPLYLEGLSLAVAVEDPRILIEAPSALPGNGRTQVPDFITRLRLERDWGEFQGACVIRELGYQPLGESVISKTAWGFNFTGSFLVTHRNKVYYQVTFGEGIGSYRGSPDVVATGPNSGQILPMFGWMVGVKQEWTDRLTSNLTFSQLSLGDVPGQDPDNLKDTTYLAVNLIANPYERVFCGVEYLFGIRDDVSGARGTANRLQMSFGFYLP